MMTSKIFFMFMNMIIISNILMIYSIHPIYMLFSFIAFTFSSSMLMFSYLNYSFYSFMILISLIGGMMIMFNYFISLINNENMKLKYFELMNQINFIIIIIISLNYLNYLIPSLYFYENMNLNNLYMKIHNIYYFPMNFLTMIIILFLLMCLTLSFKMSTIKMIPLRKIKI